MKRDKAIETIFKRRPLYKIIFFLSFHVIVFSAIGQIKKLDTVKIDSLNKTITKLYFSKEKIRTRRKDSQIQYKEFVTDFENNLIRRSYYTFSFGCFAHETKRKDINYKNGQWTSKMFKKGDIIKLKTKKFIFSEVCGTQTSC